MSATLQKIGASPRRVSPIVPQDMDQVAAYAKKAVAAGLYKGDGNGDLVAQCEMVITKALDIGLSITTALTALSVKDGNWIIKADAYRALLWGAGFTLDEKVTGTAGTTRMATCIVTRPDGKTITREFSIADAIRAKVYQTEPDSYWQRYEDRLLAARALGFAARDGASDVAAGLYVREEFDGAGGQQNAGQPYIAKPVKTDEVPHTAPTPAPIVTDFDIPDETGEPGEPPSPPKSQDEVLREIERAIETGEKPELIEVRFIAAINTMDADGKEQAFAMLYPEK